MEPGVRPGRGEWPAPADALAEAAELAVGAGLRRIHLLAWRDGADVEAGGSELHATTVARLWAEAGMEVTMRTSYAAAAAPESTCDGYRVIRKAGRYLVFPRGAVAELAGRHGPRDGLVEIWNGVPWLTPLWARGPKVAWVHHVHGAMWGMVLPPRLARVGEVLERRVAPPLYRRQRIVTLSASSRCELVEQLGFHPDRVAVVPPGIDPRFSPGLGRGPHPLVVAVGRLTPVKRFDRLIDEVAAVRERVPGLELVIVGEGAERERLEARVAAVGGEGWIRLPGRVTDDALVALYRRAWVVASASVAEGWGMTITEAAACATPAVVTDIAGHRDAVVHGVTGVLAPSGELGAALADLLADEPRRRRMGQAAHDRSRTFTWEATAAGTLAVLVDASAAPRSRAARSMR